MANMTDKIVVTRGDIEDLIALTQLQDRKELAVRLLSVPTPQPHDSIEWADLIEATRLLGIATARWDEARKAYTLKYPIAERTKEVPPWQNPQACWGHCDPEGWYSPCKGGTLHVTLTTDNG